MNLTTNPIYSIQFVPHSFSSDLEDEKAEDTKCGMCLDSRNKSPLTGHTINGIQHLFHTTCVNSWVQYRKEITPEIVRFGCPLCDRRITHINGEELPNTAHAEADYLLIQLNEHLQNQNGYHFASTLEKLIQLDLETGLKKVKVIKKGLNHLRTVLQHISLLDEERFILTHSLPILLKYNLCNREELFFYFLAAKRFDIPEVLMQLPPLDLSDQEQARIDFTESVKTGTYEEFLVLLRQASRQDKKWAYNHVSTHSDSFPSQHDPAIRMNNLRKLILLESHHKQISLEKTAKEYMEKFLKSGPLDRIEMREALQDQLNLGLLSEADLRDLRLFANQSLDVSPNSASELMDLLFYLPLESEEQWRIDSYRRNRQLIQLLSLLDDSDIDDFQPWYKDIEAVTRVAHTGLALFFAGLFLYGEFFKKQR